MARKDVLGLTQGNLLFSLLDLSSEDTLWSTA